MSAAERAQAVAVAQVAEFMCKQKLALDDLINIGGHDLKSPNKSTAGKARCVERCWELMARLGVKFVDIEHSERVPQPNTRLGGTNSTWREGVSKTAINSMSYPKWAQSD